MLSEMFGCIFVGFSSFLWLIISWLIVHCTGFLWAFVLVAAKNARFFCWGFFFSPQKKKKFAMQLGDFRAFFFFFPPENYSNCRNCDCMKSFGTAFCVVMFVCKRDLITVLMFDACESNYSCNCKILEALNRENINTRAGWHDNMIPILQ